MDRRKFLQSTAIMGVASGLASRTAAQAAPLANDRITICVMGVRGRGGN